MGSVVLPTTGLVYVDANVVIYTVEKHPRYNPVLRPLWSAVTAGQARVLVSELVLLETLVGPYRANDSQLVADDETFLRLPGMELVAVSTSILREAARLRSRLPHVRSPDAIHAATGNCSRGAHIQLREITQSRNSREKAAFRSIARSRRHDERAVSSSIATRLLRNPRVLQCFQGVNGYRPRP